MDSGICELRTQEEWLTGEWHVLTGKTGGGSSGEQNTGMCTLWIQKGGKWRGVKNVH